ncbi:MAG: NapC/NirT family cytochrome c [Chloroflexi bacterium]|nr:NapC/NirT family cytochrome c [Chloroflexota bacterium]
MAGSLRTDRLSSLFQNYTVIDLRQPRQRRRLIFFLIAGTLEVVLFAMGGFRVEEYMNTPQFCGQFCHKVMKPEYTAYQNSPHARVSCVACHIGSGAEWQVKMKLTGIGQAVATAMNTYPRPLPSPVIHLRPARETCETCHWPQKVSDDRLRIYRRYGLTEKNEASISALALKVGGGGEGEAKGIHWHVSSQIWYLPLDRRRQDIGWLAFRRPDGTTEELFRADQRRPELEARLPGEKRLMDCIDCHNRATHVFRSPEELVDKALTTGQLDGTLPYIKKKSLEALTPPEKAQANISALPDFYRSSYPNLYREKEGAINQAIVKLREIADLTYFPEMKVNWKTYPNNVGHTDSPGCFRCHGQKFVNVEGTERTIDGSCNLCHYSVPKEALASSGK